MDSEQSLNICSLNTIAAQLVGIEETNPKIRRAKKCQKPKLKSKKMVFLLLLCYFYLILGALYLITSNGLHNFTFIAEVNEPKLILQLHYGT